VGADEDEPGGVTDRDPILDEAGQLGQLLRAPVRDLVELRRFTSDERGQLRVQG
jgi:hypothetical protein